MSGNITDEYVFFGGKRVPHVAMSSGSVYYYAEDFLGSSRVITDSQGHVCYEADFDPYGAEWDVTTSCAQNYKFQGKERDTETNNDDFGARYDASSMGRFMTPDWSEKPMGVPYAQLGDPQSLDLYVYVRDNPETTDDLDGHDGCGGEGAPECVTTNPAATNTAANPALKPAPNNQAGKQTEQQTRSLSPKGLDFIKQREGYKDKVYLDDAGHPTIGYGHKLTSGENFDKGIDPQQATALLTQDVATAVDAVNNQLKVNVSQSQFDALVDFTFNEGSGHLAQSTLLKNINSARDVTEARFTDWDISRGKVDQGLENRRTLEYNLYQSGETHGP